jgi:hypothetical protein
MIIIIIIRVIRVISRMMTYDLPINPVTIQDTANRCLGCELSCNVSSPRTVIQMKARSKYRHKFLQIECHVFGPVVSRN